MKRLTLKLITLGALALAGSAFADTDPLANEIMQVQLNPAMKAAFQTVNTNITIHHHAFNVVGPAICDDGMCRVLLDSLHTDPKTFIVIHETTEGDEASVKAKVITIFPQELYELTYLVPEAKNSALTVTNMHRVYR